MPDLIVQNLAKEFPSPGSPLTILRGVSFDLSAGDNLAILGPSGSGKSTLLHILGGLEPPTSGRVQLHQIDPYQLAPGPLARFRNENIGFVFQDHHLLPQLTALENVLVPGLAKGAVSRDLGRRGEELLQAVGLAERIHHRPAQLSGGERQRVAVARALIMKPALVLADEPTGSLDRENADRVGRLICDLQRRENAMLICVTHSESLADMFQRKTRLDQGMLIPLSAPSVPRSSKNPGAES